MQWNLANIIIWNLKDKNVKYTIKWCKVKQAKSHTNVTKKCNLCLLEKYYIICKPEMSKGPEQ